MKPEHTVAATLATALALVAGLAVGADQPAPGVKRVCVPAEDGRAWECGTTDAPPRQRPVAPRDSPRPPDFLAPASGPEIMPLEAAASARAAPIDPPRTDDFPSAPDRDSTADDASTPDRDATADDASAPVAGEPAAGESTKPGENEVVDTVADDAGSTPTETASPDEPTSSEGPADGSLATSEPPVFLQPPRRRGLAPGPPISPKLPAEPVADTSAPERASIAPEPVVEADAQDVAARTAQPISTEAAADVVAEEAAPTIAPSPPPERDAGAALVDAADAGATTAVQPRDADAFRALAGTGYTVQLAHAASPEGFARAVVDLGLDARDAYTLPVRQNGMRWWMLVWSSFPDAASARAATARLPRNAGLNVGYPRRIALIQRELNP